MKFYKYMMVGLLALSFASTSCVGDLDVTPDDPNKETSLKTKDLWMGYFGSLYGNLLYAGNLTPSGVDGGAGTFSRCHWNLQELTTDEVVLLNTWNDPGYADIKFDTWTSNNVWAYMCFQREATTARICVEFCKQLDEDSGNLFTDAEKTEMKAEARAIRALCYYYMIDLFGKGPWVTTETALSSTPPTYNRQELFTATVDELLDIIPQLPLAKDQVYGRVSQEAARMLLAKLYLNAEVYTGTPMYAECVAQGKEILKTINTLVPDYRFLFCGTNDKYVGNGEILWALPSDTENIQYYGGTTYLTAGAYFDVSTFGDEGKDMMKELGNPTNKWNGLKVKPELVNAFVDDDKRALFYSEGFKNSVANLNSFDKGSDGYMCVKYRLTPETDYNNEADAKYEICFPTTDYPLFRLGDLYLMMTECQLRGVNDADPGYAYFNAIRTRANVSTIAYPTLEDVLHERQCELYWEGHRRSDLIRFNKFTGNAYNWSWKGGVLEGTDIASYRSVFAIPYQYEAAVGQNPGY